MRKCKRVKSEVKIEVSRWVNVEWSEFFTLVKSKPKIKKTKWKVHFSRKKWKVKWSVNRAYIFSENKLVLGPKTAFTFWIVTVLYI